MAPGQGTLYKKNSLPDILASMWRGEKPMNKHSKEKQIFILEPHPGDFFTLLCWLTSSTTFFH